MAGFAPLFTGQLFIVGEALPLEDSRDATGKYWRYGFGSRDDAANRTRESLNPHESNVRTGTLGWHVLPPMVCRREKRQGSATYTGSNLP
jgi:hypothetical protein